MFVTRYLDLFAYGQIVSSYNTWMKVIITLTSLHVVTSLIFRHKCVSFPINTDVDWTAFPPCRAYRLADLQDGIYRLGLPLMFAMLFSPLFTYQQTFLEICWTFSQLLGIVANIPQLVLLLSPENRGWKMTTYLGIIVGYRAFYIPHSVLRWVCSSKMTIRTVWWGSDSRSLDWGVLDPVAFGAAISEATVFAVAFLGILWTNHKQYRTNSQCPNDGISKSPSASLAQTAPGNEMSSLKKWASPLMSFLCVWH